MRKKVLAMMLLAVLFIVGCSQKMEKDGIMLGKLVNELTGDPVSGTVLIDGKEVRTDSEGNFKLETKVGNIAVKKISSSVEGYEDYSNEVIAKDGETIKIPLNPKYGETVVINGLTVKLRKGIPAKALSFVAEDYVNMVRKDAPKLIQNVGGEEQITIDKEVVYEAIDTVTASYPKPEEMASENDEVATKALEIVVEDFPDFGDKLDGETDETKIVEAYQTVSQVYVAQQTYAVNRQIINNEEKTVNKLKNNILDTIDSKLEDLEYGFMEKYFKWEALTTNEKVVGLANILQYKAMENAKNRAKLLSDSWNNQEGYNDQKDALRHTLWQYLTCEYVTANSKLYNFGNYEKNTGIYLAEALGTGRETYVPSRLANFMYHRETSKRYDFLNESNIMDIHNNGFARDYFNNTTSTTNWRVWVEWVRVRRWLKLPRVRLEDSHFNRPSELTVVNNLKSLIVNQGVYVDVSNPELREQFLNLGVKRKGVEKYSGKIIYLKKY